MISATSQSWRGFGLQKDGCMLKTRWSLVFGLTIFVAHLSPVFGNSGSNADKAAHFGISATAQTACSTLGNSVLKSRWTAAVTCFVAINTVGALKEVVDPYRGGNREAGDIYANIAGSGMSATLLSIGF